MTPYRVYLETSAEAIAEGGYLAHVPELPGCAARGKTKEEALARIREVIAADARAGGRLAGEAVQVEVTETEAPTLPPDRAKLGDADLAAVRQQAVAGRQRLLDCLKSMPAAALNWRESETTWAVRNVLAHLAQADLWYASRLEEGGLPELLWRLSAMRAVLLRHLDELPAAARDHVTVHDGEEWTPHKVARRMLEHEQEHMAQIAEILAAYQRVGQGASAL